MQASMSLTLDFHKITLKDVPRVGGKNASSGELFNSMGPLGVGVVDGFATTSDAYRCLLSVNALEDRLREILAGLNTSDVQQLARQGQAARAAILETELPHELRTAILQAYHSLCERLGRTPELSVRSSATAEDLPEASFAGQHDSFLNVSGVDGLLSAIHACYASLFTDRAIVYRAERGFDHFKIALSVGVQPMIRSDIGAAGVIFTLDTESGFLNVVEVTGAYGLGEFVVQGAVTPDEWTVFKPRLGGNYRPIVGRRLGSKSVRLVYGGDAGSTQSEEVPEKLCKQFCVTDDDVLTLANWARMIERHYSEIAGQQQPMDIEWAKDGLTGGLFILQARPETVHSRHSNLTALETYHLTDKPGDLLVTGQAVGERIGTGTIRIVRSVDELSSVCPGDILVAQNTDPDWEPVMKRVAAVVTDRGGRTAHAAIVSREMGLPCIVGTGNATAVLQTGDEATVCCAEGPLGHVYSGKSAFTIDRVDISDLPCTRTRIMMNAGDPDRAFSFATLPAKGVGLARMEFIVNNHIGIHPMALAKYPGLKDASACKQISELIGDENPCEFFVRRLSEGIGRIAAAFFPHPVIVRTSDFKTNEYAKLIGGAEFEPVEENPMLGFRGASRYYDVRYAEGFALECAALRRVRNEMGLDNVKIMIPFCRTVQEARRVIKTMAANGLVQHENGLEVYAMCELPSNVILADEFLEVFDGFSIGSNDLTQLILGIDRDSGTVSHLFDEKSDAVRKMIAQAIQAAHRAGKPIGICGQAPSDYPDFAEWLVHEGITSISLNPDAILKTIKVVAQAEADYAWPSN